MKIKAEGRIVERILVFGVSTVFVPILAVEETKGMLDQILIHI